MVQIRAKAAGADLFDEIAIRRGEHADIDAQRAIRSDALYFSGLQRAQELGLDAKRQLAELELVTTSRAAATTLAENYVGMPLT